MVELRAPDPTIDSFCSTAITDKRLLVSDDTSVRGGAVAHLPYRSNVGDPHRTDCGLHLAGEGFQVQQARHARWFAVACPRCFPGTPPPGHVWSHPLELNACFYASPHPHLKWQLA